MAGIGKCNNNSFERLSSIILIGVLFSTGTYIRNRAGQDVPTVDYLVIVQMSFAIIGGLIGMYLISRVFKLGVASKVAFLYLIGVFASLIITDKPMLVVGYCALLAGACLFIVGIVETSNNIETFYRIEKIFLFTLLVNLTKDLFISMASRDLNEAFYSTHSNSEGFRLGMGITHANSISLLAVFVFTLSFNLIGNLKSHWFLWFIRGGAVLIVVLSRSRVSLVSLGLVIFLMAIFHIRRRSKDSLNLHMLFISFIGFAGTLFLFLYSKGIKFVVDAVKFLYRGQDNEAILSLTGRTEIWPVALQKSLESPGSIIFGHGYGATRFYLNDGDVTPPFFAFHCHNAFLESFFSTGLLGFIPLTLLIALGLRWFFLKKNYVDDMFYYFSMRSSIIILIILVSSITESYISVKLSPVIVLFFFYVIAFDKISQINSLRPLESSSENKYGKY